MDGHNPHRLFAVGPDRFVLGGSFQTNAGSNPSSTTFRGTAGMPFTVTYAATGVYTVTLPAGFRLPAQPLTVVASPQFAVLATDWFDVAVIGESTLNASTRQFVLQTHRSGVAREVANTAGNRVNFMIFASNNTGR